MFICFEQNIPQIKICFHSGVFPASRVPGHEDCVQWPQQGEVFAKRDVAHIVLKLTRSLKFFLRQITIEAEILQENDDDEETRVRFSFIPNIQTNELNGTGMQGVKRKSLMFADLIFLVFPV